MCVCVQVLGESCLYVCLCTGVGGILFICVFVYRCWGNPVCMCVCVQVLGESCLYVCLCTGVGGILFICVFV